MKYIEPEMEMIKLTIEDVVTKSPQLNDDGNNFGSEDVYEDDGNEWA